MVNRLLRAPMAFFHANPHGRIINRFTKDITDIDKLMIMFTSMVFRAIVQLSGTLVIIGVATPYTLLTFVPVFCVFYFVQRYFQETSRELKRLDATTRSPIYAHFSECLNGITNIRAYKRAKSVNKSLGTKLNSHLRMNLAQFSANRWLSVRLELLGGSLVLFSCIFVVIGYKQIDAAGAGMQLSFALQITGLLNMLVRLSSLAENSFNAVERIKEYSDINEEQPNVEKHDEVLEKKQKWPMEGNIKYNEVVARYRDDLPAVLNGLTFDIKPEEKVGLVGRTGAGKSSLFLTLFRIVERDSGDSGGSITIDGVDISSVGLKLLRDSISIIPQEPVLFVGTIRFNLDPFNQYTDAAIWRALDNAHMKEIIQASGQGLDMAVEESGTNFSVGQRQLVSFI
jgi:ATP-binding cassette, subfamily C (CFTR/MRP), member 1